MFIHHLARQNVFTAFLGPKNYLLYCEGSCRTHMLGPPLAMRLPLSWSRASAQLPALCCCPPDSAGMQATRPPDAPDAASPPLVAAVSPAGVRRRSQMRTAPSPLPAKRLCSPSIARLHWWPPPPWVSVAVQPGARPSQRQIVRSTLPLAILALPAATLKTCQGARGRARQGAAGMGRRAWGLRHRVQLGCNWGAIAQGCSAGADLARVAQPCAHAAQGRAVPQAHAQVIGAAHLP